MISLFQSISECCGLHFQNRSQSQLFLIPPSRPPWSKPSSSLIWLVQQLPDYTSCFHSSPYPPSTLCMQTVFFQKLYHVTSLLKILQEILITLTRRLWSPYQKLRDFHGLVPAYHSCTSLLPFRTVAVFCSAKHTPSSGPFHLLFALPGMLLLPRSIMPRFSFLTSERLKPRHSV